MGYIGGISHLLTFYKLPGTSKNCVIKTKSGVDGDLFGKGPSQASSGLQSGHARIEFLGEESVGKPCKYFKITLLLKKT